MQTYALAHVDAAAIPLYNDAFALWNGAAGAKTAVPVTNGSGPLQDANGHLGCGTGTFWNANIAAPGGGVFGTTVPCTYAFAKNASETNTESLFTLRGDYNITDKQKLALRFNTGLGPSGHRPELHQSGFQFAEQSAFRSGPVDVYLRHLADAGE